MGNLRLLLADDHEIVRHGIRAILDTHRDWTIVAEAVDGRSAVDKATELVPDIAILDIGMPNLNGLEATRQILARLPRTKVLILTMYESSQVLQQAVRAGAKGLLLKSDAVRDLVNAVEALERNRTFFSTQAAPTSLENQSGMKVRSVSETLTRERLTPREREVVQLLAEGKSTKEMAVSLGISVKTAETHRSNIMRKLDLHSVSELVLYAIRNNIVQVLDPMDSAAIPNAPSLMESDVKKTGTDF